ncbi:hypothetical protein AZF37_04345 [endosymbiont 'TC1' of Trimyema compressum]|uniref:hypothetical protein n=1 Tax=endosymbiont 'TC1' of Trimyema compressum TaxID=243899 RepID=UPI0007F18780|nr:hypothetical protein [endosymbiont 'TC1' of Trimyema compressum]AMP20498.1 hypothetical protein AZF37_04345 [endosymbiont 'TC1' of Trimyema compressum]
MGRVVEYQGHKATILLKNDLDLGDKIAFWTKRDGRVVTEVGKIELNGNIVKRGFTMDKRL